MAPCSALPRCRRRGASSRSSTRASHAVTGPHCSPGTSCRRMAARRARRSRRRCAHATRTAIRTRRCGSSERSTPRAARTAARHGACSASSARIESAPSPTRATCRRRTSRSIGSRARSRLGPAGGKLLETLDLPLPAVTVTGVGPVLPGRPGDRARRRPDADHRDPDRDPGGHAPPREARRDRCDRDRRTTPGRWSPKPPSPRLSTRPAGRSRRSPPRAWPRPGSCR